MQDIGSAIKAKREAIQRLQNELDVLERAWALLEGEPVSSSSPSQVPAQERHLSGPPSKGQFSPTSQVGMTIAVLRDAGAPLHVDEIITRIAQRGTTVKKTSLVGSVARLVTEKRIFYRKKPNVYGLIEWQGAKAALIPLHGALPGSARPTRVTEATDPKSEAGWSGRH